MQLRSQKAVESCADWSCTFGTSAHTTPHVSATSHIATVVVLRYEFFTRRVYDELRHRARWAGLHHLQFDLGKPPLEF